METKNNRPKSNLVAAAGIAVTSFILGYLLYLGISAMQRDQYATDRARMQKESTPAVKRVIRSRMSAVPEAITTEMGMPVEVAITLDAKDTPIHGADIILVFDPSYLEFFKVTGVSEQNRTFSLLRGLNEQNRVIISVIATNQVNGAQTDTAPVVTVTFTAKAKGKTTIGFEHNPGTTTGSTIIEAATSENILDDVGMAQVEIR